MKSTLIAKAAAALMLLASAGAMFLVLPAAAQPPAAVPFGVPSGASRVAIIERFELSGTVAAGNALETVEIPGVVGGQVMPEVSPGVYELTTTLGPREDPRAYFAAVATLRGAGTIASARLGGSASAPVYGSAEAAREEAWRRGAAPPPPHASRDDRPPQITNLTPAHGQRVRDRDLTRISAHFADDASGVDRGSVRLRVDGRDVTSRASVDRDDVFYTDDLAPGRHVAEVIVRDRAGNVARQSWSFEVMDRYRGDRGERWGRQY
jgi:hypothetical protein